MIGTNQRFAVIAAVLAMAAAMVFLPGLDGGFIFDDKPNIVTNAALHVTKLSSEDLLYAAYSFQPGNGSRSLPMLTFALDHLRGGLDARVFKVTNLTIHVLTTFALMFLFRRLLILARWEPRRAAAGGIIVAFMWAVHPLQVSSVLYVVQRMQTLCTFFLVLALMAYVAMRQAQLQGERSRHYGVLAILFWVLGLASKEDALLLPAYALALELTFFNFGALRSGVAKVWRRGYLIAGILGVVFYLFYVVPHYWYWSAYPGRDFSTYERLLTQGRVLAMYLQQILLPLPASMPFYYDDVDISRGWLQPISTLFTWLMLVGLLVWAWCWRARRPLFAFGVFIFFIGHFMTSNVINLELVFEHRNHFPMIGVLLAGADLSAWFFVQKREGLLRISRLLLVALVFLYCGLTINRAHIWGEPLRFAENSVGYSPLSARAWMALGSVYADRSGLAPESPWFDQALVVSQVGGRLTGSAPLLANVVVFKTISGNAEWSDWAQLLERLRQVPMSAENKNVLWVLLGNAEKGIPMSERGMLEAIEVVSRRSSLSASEYMRIGAYIHNDTHKPQMAFQYLQRAVELSPVGDQDVSRMMEQLREAGRDKWVRSLEVTERAKENAR